MWSKIKCLFDASNKFDPLSSLFPKFFRKHKFLLVLLITFIQLGFWWVYGNFVVNTYPGNITGPRNLDTLLFGLFLRGIFTPFLLWECLSFCKTWINLSESLCNEGLVNRKSFSLAIKTHISESYFLPTMIISLGITLLYYFVGIPAEITRGRFSFWFITTFSKAIHCLFVYFYAYVIINFVLRSLILILRLKKYFDVIGINTIHVYHVDRCGGFSPIGNLAIRLGSIAVATGIWAVGYSILPFVSGGEFNFSSVVIALYLAYFILVIFIFVSLIGPANRAMKRYKQDVVMKLSRKLQDELNVFMEGKRIEREKDDVSILLSKAADVNKLNILYEQLLAMPESPIKSKNLKRYTSIALIPAILGIVSFAADLSQIMTIIP